MKRPEPWDQHHKNKSTLVMYLEWKEYAEWLEKQLEDNEDDCNCIGVSMKTGKIVGMKDGQVVEIKQGDWDRRFMYDEELYCPYCGQQGVLVEMGLGDYYVGPDYMCEECEEVFHLC